MSIHVEMQKVGWLIHTPQRPSWVHWDMPEFDQRRTATEAHFNERGSALPENFHLWTEHSLTGLMRRSSAPKVL